MADVSGIWWDQIATESDAINVIISNWSNSFSSTIGKHAPLTEMCVSEKYCPWINRDPKDLMQTRDRLKKVAKQASPYSLWILIGR